MLNICENHETCPSTTCPHKTPHITNIACSMDCYPYGPRYNWRYDRATGTVVKDPDGQPWFESAICINIPHKYFNVDQRKLIQYLNAHPTEAARMESYGVLEISYGNPELHRKAVDDHEKHLKLYRGLDELMELMGPWS